MQKRKTGMRLSGKILFICCLAVSFTSSAEVAKADDPATEVISAVGDVINGVVSIPVGAIAGTVSGPPVIGTVGGILLGTVNTLSCLTRGLLRLVGVAIPLAAQAAPYIPLFL